MKTSIQAKVDHYLELLEQLKGKVSDEGSAVRILSEIAKDERMDQMREEREGMNGEPATTKQLQYMKTLGVEIAPGLTKRQASKLIDHAAMGQEE
jgi:phage gp16-like protein